MKKILGLFLCLALIFNTTTMTLKKTNSQENTYYCDINVEKDVEDL